MNTKDTDVSTKSMLTLMAEEMPRDAWPSEASHAVCAESGRHGSMEHVVFSKGIPVKDRYDGGWTMFYNRDTLEHNSEWALGEHHLSAVPHDWQSAVVSKQDFFIAKQCKEEKEKQGMAQNKQRKKGDYIILSELSYDEKWQFINDCGNDGADLCPIFVYNDQDGYAIQWDCDNNLELWRSVGCIEGKKQEMDTKDVTEQYKTTSDTSQGMHIYTMTDLFKALAEESEKDPDNYALQFEYFLPFSKEWIRADDPEDLICAVGDEWPVRRKVETFDVDIQGMPKHENSDLCFSGDVVNLRLSYEFLEEAEEAFYKIREALKGNQKR